MALRIARPDLAVVALDAVQHSLQRQLRYEAAYESARSRLELARGAADLGELGDSYAVASWNANYFGSFEEARLIGREGFELLRADAPLYAVHALAWAALAGFYLGDWDGCLDDFGLVVGGLGDRGELQASGFSIPWPAAALIHEARGDRTASQRLLEAVYDLEERTRTRRRVSTSLSPLILRTLLLRGETQAARARFEAVTENDPQPENLPLLQLAQAELLLVERRWDDLDELAAAMRRTREWSGARFLDAAAQRVAGRVAAASANAAEGTRLLEAAAASYDVAGMAVDAAVARVEAAEAALAGSRRDDAMRLAAAAAVQFRRAGFCREIDRAESLVAQTTAS
jgi:hypothetical protein